MRGSAGSGVMYTGWIKEQDGNQIGELLGMTKLRGVLLDALG